MKSLNLNLLAFLIIGSIQAQTFTKLNNNQINNTTGSWRSVSPVDLDNNYTLDLLLGSGANGTNALFENTGKATYQKVTGNNAITGSSSSAQAFVGDYDDDCDLDIFWADVNGFTNLFYENNGDGSFSQVTSGDIHFQQKHAVIAAWADLNNDSQLELLVPEWQAFGTNYIYQDTNGSGLAKIDTGDFANATGKIWGMALADYDLDGDLDVYLANRSGNNYFLENRFGHLKLDTASILSKDNSGSSASWGDYNNDGYPDLYVGRVGMKNLLYKNLGNGKFGKATLAGAIVSDSYKTGGTNWDDLDNDGDLDMYTTQTGSFNKNNIIYKNNGSGFFTKVSSGSVYSETKSTEGGVTADLNNDGFIDIANANRFNDAISVFLNNTNSNNYIKLRLYGTNSNRMALGSRVKIVSPTIGQQHRELTVPKGRRTTGAYELHFGLGQDTIIDSLIVSFPSGNQCILTNIQANQSYNIEEGTCIADPYTQAVIQDSVQYLNASFSADSSTGAITRYHWDFGDGDTSNLQNPNHRYISPGIYTVTLTAYDNYCKWDSAVKVISVCTDSANPGFTDSSSYLNVSFVDTTQSLGGHSTSWDFGDGITGTGKNVQHVYQSTGTYQVCLTVDDSCHTYTVCDSIQVCDSLQTGFGYSLVGKKITLTDSSNGTTVKYLLGDGSSANRANISYNYAQGGYYDVCQIVSNACVTDTLCKRIGVCVDTAVSAFSHSATNKQVSFSSNNSQNAKQYFWDFGDGNTSTQANPTHLYQSFQTYNVCLIVSNNCFSDTTCKTIDICPYAPGVAGFNYNLLGIPNGVKFNQQAQNAVSYQWDFGDGGSSTNPNPSHVFPRKDTFKVCLTVTDSCNSQDTDCQIVDLVNVSLDEFDKTDFEVYPNPVEDQLNLSFGFRSEEGLQVNIYNTLGQKVKSFALAEIESGVEHSISLKELSSGTYFLQFETETRTLKRRVAIIKK